MNGIIIWETEGWGEEGATTGTCVRMPAGGVPFVHQPVNTELTVRAAKDCGRE